MAVTTPVAWMNSNCRWKMSGLVAVEAHDEAAHDLEAGRLDGAHGLAQIAAQVLQLVALAQARGAGGLEAQEHLLESRADHQLEQVGMRRHVHRGLGQEGHAGPVRRRQSIMARRRSRQRRRSPMKLSSTTNTGPRQPRFAEGSSSATNLRRRLVARAAAVERHHVAELAIEGTAAAGLHRQGGVVPEVDQIPARQGREGEVGKAGPPDRGAATVPAACPIGRASAASSSASPTTT